MSEFLAYIEGWRAAAVGKALCENPYAARTPQYQAFRDGWFDQDPCVEVTYDGRTNTTTEVRVAD